MKLALVLAGVALLADADADAGAPPARVRANDAPCTGCRASYPAGAEPVPLLVVLHGDGGQPPSTLVSAWEEHAAKRGVAVLALKCPVELGCKGSWWQWNGDPAWLKSQVDAFEKKRPLDRSRVWLAGWSGGASYMGLRARELGGMFAALVHHGGGVSPGGPCAPEGIARAPVYFLVGDANPLHSLAIDLRSHHEACGSEVTWKLLPRADHAAEWSALEANGGAIADWLLTKRRVI
ncbi:MAG: hypothetical protein KIT84_26010 [Labilithrix sp.]|nr:hypothetical protein [Labilithrix sp.]MCW5814510.1 hypothetical protein [Labilithrix sp.]